MNLNTGTQGAPVWTPLTTTAQEWRYASTRQTNVASASWPQETRPASGATQLAFLHCYTADAVGDQVVGTFALTNYMMAQWANSAGTFASAPVLTAYPSSAHGSITRGDGSMLGGHPTDTGATARSYLKGLAYGQWGQAPAAAPAGAPGASDGTTGGITPASAAWQASWQGLQGDNDFIQAGATPGAAGAWYFLLALFMGANETPGLWQPVLSVKYTWT